MSSEQINSINNFRPTVVCCCIADKKLLMFLKKDYKMWLLPQGGVNDGETYEEAITRELQEEVGADLIKIINGEPHFFHESELEFSSKRVDQQKFANESGANQDIKGKHYYFYVVPCSETKQDLVPAKFDEHFWADYTAAKGLLNLMYQLKKKEQLLTILEKLKEGGFIE